MPMDQSLIAASGDAVLPVGVFSASTCGIETP
jgi:hypothetical protein